MSEADTDLPAMSPAQQAAWDEMAGAKPAPAPAPAVAPPPAPAPAPAPAPSEDPADAVLANDGKKYVPVATLVSERQTLKGQMNDLRATNEALQRTLDAALAGRQPPAAPAAPAAPAVNPHDPNLNPIDHMKWENDSLKKEVEAIKADKVKAGELTQQQKAMQDAQQAYSEGHGAFTAKNPEYQKAYDWLVSKMIAMHKEGMGYPENVSVNMAHQLEWNTVVDALNKKQNPFMRLWNMSKSLGYVPAAPAPGAQPGARSVADQIKAASEAGDAAISLSGIPGGSPPIASLQSLVTMSKEELSAKFANDPDGRLWQKLAGGF